MNLFANNQTRREFLRLGFALGIILPSSRWSVAANPELASGMGQTAQAWLSLLTPAQRKKAQLAWDSPWREDWHFTPRRRPGLTLNEMTEQQSAALWNVLASLLSPRGIKQTQGVIELERILGEITDNLRFRDPGNYALALFGDPTGSSPWGCRFEGHHLSLTAIVVPGVGIATTPAFFGANPATVGKPHPHARGNGTALWFITGAGNRHRYGAPRQAECTYQHSGQKPF